MVKLSEKFISIILCIAMLMAIFIPNFLFCYAADESADVASGVAVSEENFPDKGFREYISKFIDDNEDGYLSQSEIDSFEVFSPRWHDLPSAIKSLEGIACFKNLKILDCSIIQIQSLDVSQNTALEELVIFDSQLTDLDVSNCPKLKTLKCTHTQLTSLDVSKNTALESLLIYKTQISELNLGKNNSLKTLSARDTLISELDVSNCPNLVWLSCENTNITALDVSKNTALEQLMVSNTLISELDVRNCSKLLHIFCHNTNLTSLDLSKCKNLKSVNCDNNNIEVLNLKNNHKLNYVYASNSTVILSATTFLKYKINQKMPDNMGYVIAISPTVLFSTNTTVNAFCNFAANIIAGILAPIFMVLGIRPS